MGVVVVGLATFLRKPPWALLQAACAHRAAAAEPALRTYEPSTPGRAASLGRLGSVSASHCQSVAASATAGNWASSRRQRRNIHWNDVEGDGRMSSSETRPDRRRWGWGLCARPSGPVHRFRWDSLRRCLQNGRFARWGVRLRGPLRSSVFASSHRVGSVVCWMNGASSSAWTSTTFYNSGTADLWHTASSTESVNPFSL